MNLYRKLLAGLVGASCVLSSIMTVSAGTGTPISGSPSWAVIGKSEAEATTVTAEAAVGALMHAAAQSEYIKGKAIAIVSGEKGPGIGDRQELIAEISADAVKSTVMELKETGAASDFALQRLQSAAAESYTIWKVSDQSCSTEQLLLELCENPHVIIAEPEYLAYAAREEEATEAAEDESKESDGSGATAEQSEAASQSGSNILATETAAENPAGLEKPGPGDLTAMQWDLADTSGIYTTPLSPNGGYSLGIAGWKEGRLDEKAPANAGGTICVMDTGIDTDHPDLRGVLYEFTKEQQAKYGCGRYGYNASGDGRPVQEQKAVDSHGTHVAGIIAASWNKEGVSGIAHGVKIFSVNAFGGNGMEQEMSSVLKGFEFLIACAQEVNLKAVNCSWGTVQPQFALSVMIDELGKKGVNTVIASGNRYCDLDESIDMGSQVHSVSAIVVNAASGDGAMTDFSCWGQDSTDVFAPGGEILSTVPHILQDGEGEHLFSYQDNTRFYPEASRAGSLQNGIERFDEETSGVLFFDANPALDDKAKEIGEIDKHHGFDDKSSMALPLTVLSKDKGNEQGSYAAVNGFVYMAIPVRDVEQVRWIGVKTAMSDGFKPSGGIDSVTFAGEGGEPVEIDRTGVSVLHKGWNTSAFYTIYQCQWTPLSYNVQGYLDASNQLHEKVQAGMTEEEKLEMGLSTYVDPGKIEGLYEWEHEGSKYVIARIGIGEVTSDSRETEVQKETALLIDNVALGGEDAYTASYGIISGTSMAAPAVTGCLAVIAKDEPENASLTDAQLEALSKERAAKLLAAVEYDDELASLCRTGGRVNLQGQTTFTRKAPLIQAAEARDRVLTVDGSFFGSSGKIEIDDREYEAKSWEDGRIEVNLGTLTGGPHVVKVTNEEGAIMRAAFSSSSENGEGARLFEQTHSLPIREQAFIEDRSDRIYGPIAACGDSIYTMTVTAKYHDAQAMWRYDIKADQWSRHALPEGFSQQSVVSGCMASMRDQLYLFGTYQYDGEDGETKEKGGLWRYEPYGDSWERLEVSVPNGSCGICALHDTLWAVGGVNFDAGEEDDFKTHIYKIDLLSNTSTRIGGNLPEYVDITNAKITTSKDRLYIYAGSDFEHEKDTVSEGYLLRVTLPEAEGQLEVEDLTDVLDSCLGDGLRTEYSLKSGGDEPGEHFAIAGFDNGVAIIGSATAGEDVHLIGDNEDQAEVYDKASSYHQAFDPLAVCSNGRLYVIGYNTTETDVMYFRSDKITRSAEANNAPEGRQAVVNRYIGPVTIGLFAIVLCVLALLRKKG